MIIIFVVFKAVSQNGSTSDENECVKYICFYLDSAQCQKVPISSNFTNKSGNFNRIQQYASQPNQRQEEEESN